MKSTQEAAPGAPAALPAGEPPAGGSSRRRGRRAIWLNLILLAALLAALLLWVDLRSVWQAIAGMPPLLLAAALLVATTDRFLMGYKWRQLIVAGGGRIRIREVVSAYYQSAFSGRIFPIGIGQDVLRGYLAARAGVPVSLLFSSMAVEKLIAVFANVLMALLGLAYLAGRLPPETRSLLLLTVGGGMGVVLAGVALSFFRPVHRLGQRLLHDRLPAKLSRALGRASESLLTFRTRPGVLGVNLLLAAGELFLQFLKFFVLGRALGVALPALPFFATIAVVLFARRVTAYFEGWGLSEATSVVLFTLLGIDRDTAVALALANYAVSTLATLPGAWLLYRSGRDVRGWSPQREDAGVPETTRG